MSEVKRSDLEDRATIGSTRSVGADVALERRSRTFKQRLVAGDEKLKALLKLVR